VAFLGHLGLNTVKKSKEKAKNPLNGLANEPARTLPASRAWCRWPAFASGVVPGLVLVPPSQPRENQPGNQSLSPSIPIGHVWRSDLTQILYRWPLKPFRAHALKTLYRWPLKPRRCPPAVPGRRFDAAVPGPRAKGGHCAYRDLRPPGGRRCLRSGALLKRGFRVRSSWSRSGSFNGTPRPGVARELLFKSQFKGEAKSYY
jgi:hypothetical protein